MEHPDPKRCVCRGSVTGESLLSHRRVTGELLELWMNPTCWLGVHPGDQAAITDEEDSGLTDADDPHNRPSDGPSQWSPSRRCTRQRAAPLAISSVLCLS